MSFFKTLQEKPWETPETASVEGSRTDAIDQTFDPAKIALRFIMAVVSVLFFLFIITFLSRSQYPDFEALAGQPWQPFSDASRLWINTLILALASLSIQFGVKRAREQRSDAVVIGVSLAAFFSILFLVAQLDLWRGMLAMGFYVNTNPANSYIYALTGIHGLHLLGGLIVLANVVFRIWYDEKFSSISRPLQHCATYWHFLFGIWLLLFALLTSEAETINTLAGLCGF